MLVHARYEVGETLGRGAQGVVLRVVDREDRTRELVAKVVSATSETASLEAEFALLSRLRIPGLARAHDWGRDTATKAPFFVEDFVDGPDALTYLSPTQAPDELARRATKLIVGVATTLGALHAAGFVHGDLKPAHVRVDTRGTFRLLDLGSAVLHGRSSRGATAKWAAPEVLAGGAVTPRADLYSLGAILRDVALPPSLEKIVAALTSRHPADRPESAYAVVGMLGRAASTQLGAMPAPIGRDEALAFLLDAQGARVRAVVGPSGVGKSHLLREAFVRALLAGDHARWITAAVAPQLTAFLRGAKHAWPFTTPSTERTALFVDDLERMPRELTEALVAYVCRASDSPVALIVAGSSAPAGAATHELGPLQGRAFERLCAAFDVQDTEQMRQLSGGLPGLVAAATGRVPLSKQTALERVRGSSEDHIALLSGLALVGGSAPRAFAEALLSTRGVAAERELTTAGLLTRHEDELVLFSRGLARDLAEALGSCARVDAVAGALMSLPHPPTRALLACANAPYPPTRRGELFARAALEARATEQRAEETDALMELALDPATRRVQDVVRLERLLRDAGNTADQARAVDWLAARTEPAIASLASRRRAERAARQGNHAEALALAQRANDLAGSDPTLLALAKATLGAVHLYASDALAAHASLMEARSMLATTTLEDREECARLDHNLGVLALIRGEVPAAVEALRRSLEVKRQLRDLAGVRSCLLNLGIAHGKSGELVEASSTLDEALALARALGQRAGAGWCLVARADVEVRRGDALSAERFGREAEAIADALPAAVRADLSLAFAEARLLLGDGEGANKRLLEIPAGLDDDAVLDARTSLVRGRALLATLPADRRGAARCAIRALRRARASELSELLAPALTLLRNARGIRLPSENIMQTIDVGDRLWDAAQAATDALTEEAIANAILRVVVSVTRAERAFLVDRARSEAWGMDADGLPIASAAERVGSHASQADTEVSYQRDVESSNGRGSRATVARGQLALVVEHRFVAGAFDSVPKAFFERAAVLAALSLRGSPSRPEEHAAFDVAEHAMGETTVLPTHASRRAFPQIRGASRALAHALARLDSAIDSDLPALILGETGTGKELFARALHDFGARSKAVFVALNCAAVPDALFEAELFGHVKGAFTSADRARPGLLARAEGGTLFLDEIGDLAPARQASLLRALETRRYRAVGSDDERAFDVRIVSATHRDLAEASRNDEFRADLLYRLRVLEIAVPPLREREGDVVMLARHFLEAAGSKSEITPLALEAIASYAWPGNVRELMHAMQRLAALRAPRIDREHLPRELRAATPKAPKDEKEDVRRALEQTGGNISHAAAQLGITRHGLKKRMLRLGMRSKS